MAEPSSLTGAAENPDSLVFSQKNDQRFCFKNLCVFFAIFCVLNPNKAFSPGRSSFSNWARDIAMLRCSYIPVVLSKACPAFHLTRASVKPPEEFLVSSTKSTMRKGSELVVAEVSDMAT